MNTRSLEQSQAVRDPLEERLARLPLRERKKMRTRRAIQDHALRLFTEQGYEATTVEQIAAAAEVSPSTFFRYFATKEDVVLTDEYDPIIEELFQAQPAGLSPLEALRRAMREALGPALEQDLDQIVGRVRLMFEVPAIQARAYEQMRDGTLAVIVRLAAERTGRRLDDPEVQAWAWAVLGVMQSALFDWLEKGATGDLLDMVDRNLEFLAAGVPL